MDPVRSAEEVPQDSEEQPQASIEDIMRDATLMLRLTPAEPRWDESQDKPTAGGGDEVPEGIDPPPEPVKIKYYKNVPQTRPALLNFSFVPTPMRITAIILGIAVFILLLRLIGTPGHASVVAEDSPHTLAGIRWAMVLTGERVDEFRRTYHRTPADLGELGQPGPPLIGYERLSEDRYRLTAPSSRGPLVLDSMRPREQFLARSLDILRDPVGPR